MANSPKKWDDLSQLGAIIALASHKYADFDRKVMEMDQKVLSLERRLGKRLEKLDKLKNLHAKEVEAGYEDNKIDELEDFINSVVLEIDSGKFPERIELEDSGALDDCTLEDLIEETRRQFEACLDDVLKHTSTSASLNSKKLEAFRELESLEKEFVKILNAVDFGDVVEISNASDLAALKVIAKKNEEKITNISMKFLTGKKSELGLKNQLTKMIKSSGLEVGPDEVVDRPVEWGMLYELTSAGTIHESQ